MARPSKSALIDFTLAHELTHGLIERAMCPTDRSFVLLKDRAKKGLRIRITEAGGKHWQFETRLRSAKLFTRSLGEWPTISIDQARIEAHRLRGLTERGLDPREVEAKEKKEKAVADAKHTAGLRTAGELWSEYLETGRPKRRDAWSPRYVSDLRKMSSPGGEPKKRGRGLTRPGPLYPLLSMSLRDIHEDSLKEWLDKEAAISDHQAARALMMFRGFLRWSATKPAYRDFIDWEAGKAPALLESLPSPKRRKDALETAQVAAWWSEVEQLSNQVASVYLRALLLTGARSNEMAGLRWSDIDFRWKKLNLADKVSIDRIRTIPLSPHLDGMLKTLPKHSEWVFASSRSLSMTRENIARRARAKVMRENVGNCAPAEKSEPGHIKDARSSHRKALRGAGISHLTPHGLRRSFSLLGEAAGAPAGAIAQIMGHQPSAVAEGYRPRSIDALRPYLAKIEAYILSLTASEGGQTPEPLDG